MELPACFAALREQEPRQLKFLTFTRQLLQTKTRRCSAVTQRSLSSVSLQEEEEERNPGPGSGPGPGPGALSV